MNRGTALLAGGLAALLTVTVVTAQDAPPEEYVEAMGTIRAGMQVFTAEGAQDFAAVQEAAGESRTAFQYVQTFWNERDDQEAADLAAAGAKAAADIGVAAGLASVEGIQFSLMEMQMTCGACHMAHRTRLEDGSFVIN